jgi:cytochrome c biogenesis protein CcdA
MRPLLIVIVPFLFSGLTATGIRTCAQWVSRTSDDLTRILMVAGFTVLFAVLPVVGLLLFASIMGEGNLSYRVTAVLVWLVPDLVYVRVNWTALRERFNQGR